MKCGEKGDRYRGRFRLSGTEMDADYNGAWNIANRTLGKVEISPLATQVLTVTYPIERLPNDELSLHLCMVQRCEASSEGEPLNRKEAPPPSKLGVSQ